MPELRIIAGVVPATVIRQAVEAMLLDIAEFFTRRPWVRDTLWLMASLALFLVYQFGHSMGYVTAIVLGILGGCLYPIYKFRTDAPWVYWLAANITSGFLGGLCAMVGAITALVLTGGLDPWGWAAAGVGIVIFLLGLLRHSVEYRELLDQGKFAVVPRDSDSP